LSNRKKNCLINKTASFHRPFWLFITFFAKRAYRFKKEIIFAYVKKKSMTDIYYSYSLFAAWVLLFFFGIYLFWGKVPDKGFDLYLRSRKILGVALFLFAVQVFVQWLFDFRGKNPQIASALNLTCFYLQAILFGMSFISLLDKRYINRRQIVSDFTKWILFVIYLWVSVLAVPSPLSHILLLLASAFFFIDATRITLIFFRTYRIAVKKVQNYYSENVDCFVRWLYKSTYGIIFFGLICSVMAFAPKWAVTIYMSLGIFMFIYIFVCFLNYMINFEQIEIAVEESEDEQANESEPTSDMALDDTAKPLLYQQIEERLKIWKEEEGFRKNGITVNQLAIKLKTNRTYLSTYINKEYGCTFREWIGSMRIEMAKQILQDRSEKTIEEVAEEVGFASSSHFVRFFSQRENLSPAKWREKFHH